MDPSNEKLLDLVRLTDRSLAQIDAVALQKLIAGDSELRAEVERLELVLHASQSIGKDAMWQELNLSDAEQTAEVLDGTQALEVTTSSNLIRHVDELQSLATSGGTTETAAEIASRALLNAVRQELAASESTPPAAPVVNGEAVDLKIVDRPARHVKRTNARYRYAWPVAVAMVIAIAVLLMSLASQNDTPTPDSPTPQHQQIVEDAPAQPVDVPKELPLEAAPERQEMPQIVVDPPDEMEVEPLVVEVPKPMPRPFVPEVERPEVPQQLKWARVSGIVATQMEGSDSWYAVKADSVSLTNSDGSPQMFRTLGNSWAEALTESGIRVVIGPNTLARVAISIGDASRVQLDIDGGKIGVGNLSAATEVTVTHAAEHSEWLVSTSDTELAFDLESGQSDLQLVQGGIRAAGQSFAAPAIVSFEEGGWVAGRLTRQAPWLARPPALSALERQLSIIANEDGDLVAEFLEIRQGMNAQQAFAATVWSITLDPVRAVPLALSSPIAAQRAAAAQWLVDPANQLETLRPVFAKIQPLLANSQCNVPRWIAVARGEMPLSQSLAQNMLLGLRPAEPMFVREMAIASLMQMTGLTFPFYDINNPSRQGITQVTRAVQPWINRLP